ncbi:MAG TPA: hypothetical protein PLN19_01420 [Methanothrix sp.]|jgi:hypothetical protein|uniref:hypothetical protein n=1 Tax=Methanothrix sp. TaxID=90426 RepID=UPI002C9426E5|nr:hypothetical protein [Methanothrix sp.]HQE86910.1 hypothetical protein [Methanothrix sp.]HQI67847.1 hypothetical protein [Methanothrix sp.]HRS85699.1 hypothetical protein [Methanothrix sp.]HRU76431.1 hypothetical protein [Methanothrix sp.]
MSRSKKIAVEKRLQDQIESIPEDRRTETVLAAIRSMKPFLVSHEYERCPVCGEKWMPVEFRNGWRRCGNCCHYEEEGASAECRAEIEAESRRWMEIHHRPVRRAARVA